jgi:SAM-dependent methyltransferase
VDVTRDNVARYGGTSLSSVLPAERKIVRRFLRPSMTVLELGCGFGRVTSALAGQGLRVTAGDLSFEAVRKCRDTASTGLVSHLQLDARSLPFGDASFDTVFFAFNGVDYIHPEEVRIAALKEMARVLQEKGYLIFSSHNPVGGVLTPYGLKSRSVWRTRRAVWHMRREPYFRHDGGLLLYHATPRRIVEQVMGATGMRLVGTFGRSGLSLPLWLHCAIDAWPYYVFRK